MGLWVRGFQFSVWVCGFLVFMFSMVTYEGGGGGGGGSLAISLGRILGKSIHQGDCCSCFLKS